VGRGSDARLGAGISVLTLAFALAACWLFFEEQSVGDGGAKAQGRLALGVGLVERHQWLGGRDGDSRIQVQYLLGVDAISLSLLMLTTFPHAAGHLGQLHRRWRTSSRVLRPDAPPPGRDEGRLLAQDLLLFYVFFEFTLIPLYFLIGVWGGPHAISR